MSTPMELKVTMSDPTFGFVENHSGKVLDAKLGLVAVFRRDVVGVEFVLEVQLVQHGGVGALEAARQGRLVGVAEQHFTLKG